MSTVSVLVPVTEPIVAVTMVLPDVFVVADPRLLIEATAGVAELQVTESVRSWCVPSL